MNSIDVDGLKSTYDIRATQKGYSFKRGDWYGDIQSNDFRYELKYTQNGVDEDGDKHYEEYCYVTLNQEDLKKFSPETGVYIFKKDGRTFEFKKRKTTNFNVSRWL